ncbi:hypothetical protein DFP72DRAFT_839592 [Ephemerocybe angulata]|uniref:Uncharacterized protein n=1 Tax=Ephemerocybe angulata TaxID=980116 RepID=A0A8H6MH53_9AGAR|nr:hypothetical protein DFP72DRAFT_839592 [Tulosesus angulatus]
MDNEEKAHENIYIMARNAKKGFTRGSDKSDIEISPSNSPKSKNNSPKSKKKTLEIDWAGVDPAAKDALSALVASKSSKRASSPSGPHLTSMMVPLRRSIRRTRYPADGERAPISRLTSLHSRRIRVLHMERSALGTKKQRDYGEDNQCQEMHVVNPNSSLLGKEVDLTYTEWDTATTMTAWSRKVKSDGILA